MNKTNRRNPYIITAACLALVSITLLCTLLYKTRQSEKYYKRQVANSYQHAFSELVSSVGEMDTALQRCVVSGTGTMKSQAFTEVYGAAAAAKQALGELPQSVGAFDETSGFISRLGDYAFALSKRTASGEALADDDTQSLRTLSEATGVLSGNLTQLLADISGGNLAIRDMREIMARASKSSDEMTADMFTARIKAAELEFPETPALIYDGPFSSHIAAMKPKLTQGQPEVSQEDASKRAAEFFGVSNLTFDGERDGVLPAYMLSCPSGDGSINIEVSKAGGYVINMYSSHTPAAATLGIEDAVKAAESFVAEKLPEPLTANYHIAHGKSVTVNFAFSQDGVTCYPDLVKVDVSRETGEISGYEAQGFIMHHTKRELSEPAVSEQRAREAVSKDLEILSHALAVIPTGGKNEVFCHEFKCAGADDRHYIVYVNAETGAEERILILVENENGTLTI